MGREGVEHGRERSQIRGRGGRIRENEWGPSPLLSGKWRVPMPGTVQWQGGWVIPLDWISIAPRKWDCQDFRAARRLRESRSGPLSQGRVAGCTGYYRHHRPTFDARSHSAALRAEVVRVLLSISPYLYWSSFVQMFPIVKPLDLELHHPIAQSRQFRFLSSRGVSP